MNTNTETRSCKICEGPLSTRNKTGICARNHRCRVAQQARRNRGAKTGSSLILPAAYEIDDDDNLVLDNNGNPIEIVDEVAVRIVVAGQRRVPLTLTERRLAVDRMIRQSLRFREIADHIGTSPAKLRPVIEELGYELIPRRPRGGRQREATEIRRRKTLAS